MILSNYTHRVEVIRLIVCQIVSHVCALGMRPFGVSFLFAGWDEHRGFQLYQSDPSGNYGGWMAQAIGQE